MNKAWIGWMRGRAWLLSLCLVAAHLSGCNAGSPDRSDILTVVVGQKITTLDPATTVIPVNHIPMDLAYERLVAFELEDGLPNGRYTGELAQSWRQSADGLTWTFQLKPGHRFSDGSEVTADAVVYTFDRMRAVGLAPGQGLFWLDRVEAPSPYIVEFHLRQPVPFLLPLLALSPSSIVNPKVAKYERDGDHAQSWLSRHSAGSGPYEVVDFEPRSRVTLRVNPHAVSPPAYFQEVMIRVNTDTTSRSLQMTKGDIDLTYPVAIHERDWLDSFATVDVMEGAAPWFFMLVMNNERPPFDDPRVRRAIAMGIDAQHILDTLYRGAGNRIAGTLPAGVPGFDPELIPAAYQPERARRELRAAGVEPGHKIALTVTGSNAAPAAEVVILQRYLSELGFDVRIEQIATAARSRIFAGDFDLTIQGFAMDFPDPWIAFTFLYYSPYIGVGNMSRYRNTEVDTLLERAAFHPDPVLRTELYQEAQRLIYRDQPVVQLYRLDYRVAVNQNLNGMQFNLAQPLLVNAENMYRTEEVP